MKALIDADWFAYAHGGATTDEGHPLAWPLVASRIASQIENIRKESGADEYQLYLTGGGNFRERVATIKPYKGNRPSEKPHHYERVREYLLKFRNATLIEGMEADDAVSIEQWKGYKKTYFDVYGRHRYDFEEYRELKELRARDTGTVLCSIDKDLDMVPGWHYDWLKKKRYWIDEIDGLRSFYKQLLTGDTVDNIPGLFGVGKSSTLIKHLNDFTTELDMYISVRTQYEKRFGSGYWWQFLLENAQLLWMLREEPNSSHHYFDPGKMSKPIGPQEEIEKRLKCLEEERQTAMSVVTSEES